MPPSLSTFSPPPPAVIHWFRRALRLHDNPALTRAADSARSRGTPLLNLYVLSPPRRSNVLRQHFLRQSLVALDAALRERGSRLYVATAADDESEAEAVVRLCRGAEELWFEKETAAAARKRDAEVCKKLGKGKGNVKVVSVVGHTLYDTEDIVRENGGSVPKTIRALQSVMAKMGEPAEETPAEGELPEVPKGFRDGDGGDVPGLEAFGVEHGQKALENFEVRYEGGEEKGLARLQEFLGKEGGKVAAVFEKPNTSPAAWRDGEQETTVLSPHIALGTVSARRVFHEVRRVQEEYGGKTSQPPVSLIGQLMFRELFHSCNVEVPGFEMMKGNEMCRQVEWGEGEEADEALRKWEEGQTGYPWIDALMMQLRTTGFVHHLGRHSLACFLTRGDLWVSWERGADVFEKYLVDWDESLNAGNWMWLSASAFFHEYYRVYSPVAFGARWSKGPDFVRHYLPVLAEVPDKYILEPWKMSKGAAEKAGVKIGENYPERIVDHNEVRKENIARMKAAFAQNKADGDSEKASSSANGRASGKKGGGGAKRKSSASGGSSKGQKTYKMTR